MGYFLTAMFTYLFAYAIAFNFGTSLTPFFSGILALLAISFTLWITNRGRVPS